MTNSDEKISKFVQAITAYAEEQRQKIHQEVEDFKAERLKQAEKEVLVDAYRLIQKEQTELRSSMSREMSLREMAARQKLLARRPEMTEAIFADARQKLEASGICTGALKFRTDTAAYIFRLKLRIFV